MGLPTKSAIRNIQASTSNAAPGTTTSSWFLTNDLVSGGGSITNGSTAPTVPLSIYLDFSADGTNVGFSSGPVASGDTVNSSVNPILYTISLGDQAAWSYYRIRGTGNTGQAVTFVVNDTTVTALS